MPAPSRPTLWMAIRAPSPDELVVDRRDVELVVDAQVLRDHLIGARARNPTAAEVVDADRRLVRDHLLLDDARHQPAPDRDRRTTTSGRRPSSS